MPINSTDSGKRSINFFSIFNDKISARLKKGFATIRSVIIEAMIVIIIDSAKTFNAFLSFFVE